jgi:hypothetical protein
MKLNSHPEHQAPSPNSQKRCEDSPHSESISCEMRSNACSCFAKLWECARVLASLFENHALQREFHSIVGNANVDTALGGHGAKFSGQLTFVACDNL